jgi:hypothetical protein
MAQDNGQVDTDGYYGDDDMDSEEIDLSFLDDKEDEGASKDSASTDKKDPR